MADQPLWNPSDKDSDVALSDGNRTWMQNAGTTGSVRSTVALTSGKWRIQLLHITSAGSANRHGFATASHSINAAPGNDTTSWAINGQGDSKYNGTTVSLGGNYSNGGVVNLYIDIDNGRIWYGTSSGPFSGDPAAGTGAHHTFTGGTSIYLCDGMDAGGSNRGGTLRLLADYTGSPPSGFTDGWGDASAAQDLTPTGFANTSAFGAPTVIRDQFLTPTGYDNTSAFGTAVVKGLNTLSATGLLNTSEFGTPTIIPEQFLTATGFVNTSEFGSGIVAVGDGLTVQSLVNSSEFGSPTLTTFVTISHSSFVNTSAFGTPSLKLYLVPTSVVENASFGTAIVKGRNTLTLTGINNTSIFGTAVVARIFRLVPPSIENTSLFGSVVFIQDLILRLTGINNSPEFGNAVITRERNFTPVRRNLNSIIRMRM